MEKNGNKYKGEQIIKYLDSALKSLEEGNLDFDEPIENNDASNALCWSIEAIFLNGLKNSKANKDFWTLLKRCSHKSTLESIKFFNQIKSDVGRCRAWLRLSINECSLESYMSVITNDSSLVGRYYLPSAFLLDGESTRSMMKSVQSLSNYHFKLSCNSTVLNQWNQPPLQLAGIVSSTNLKWPQLKKGVRDLSAIGSSLSSSHSQSHSSSPSMNKSALTNRVSESDTSKKCSNGYLGLGVTSSQSAESLNSRHLRLDSLGNQSASDFLERDNLSDTSSVSHPDFRDARQEFYRTVYDISESEEDNAMRVARRTRAGLTTDTRSAEETKMENDLKFKRIIKINLDKFPLNYDQNLSASLKMENEIWSQLPVDSPTSHSFSPSSNLASPFRTNQSNNLTEEGPVGSNPARDVASADCAAVDSGRRPPTSFHGDVFLPDGDLSETRPEEGGGLPLLLGSSPEQKEKPESAVAEKVEEYQSDVFVKNSSDEGMITVEKIIESVMKKKTGDTMPEEIEEPSPVKQKRRVLKEAKNRQLNLMEHYTSIKNERGLASQCFQCRDCSAPIGMLFGRERVCSFDMCYYCPDCLGKDEAVIPSRVIFNWNFRPYLVSKKNSEYLSTNKAQPLINIEALNPSLYNHVPALNDVKMVRLKLKYLKSYLLSCDLQHVIDMHSYVGGLSYYTENIHVYSMEDLFRVPSGQLLRTMNKACNFGKFHVDSCLLCSQKGFYCEICRADSIIYPFDLENTVRCDSCRAVYHKSCKTSNIACPKCQRRAMRNSISFSEVEMVSSATEKDRGLSCGSQDFINFTYSDVIS